MVGCIGAASFLPHKLLATWAAFGLRESLVGVCFGSLARVLSLDWSIFSSDRCVGVDGKLLVLSFSLILLCIVSTFPPGLSLLHFMDCRLLFFYCFAND